MPRDDLAAWLTLWLTHGIGPTSCRRLLQHCPAGPVEILKLGESELSAAGLAREQIEALRHPPLDEVERSLEWLDAEPQHYLLTITDDSYPTLLKQIIDPPALLYCIGRIELLTTPQLAIVGSRNCTPGGADTATDFAAYLARNGLTITSGMALGIDHAAHRGALKANGNTIAVIGTGIDRIYPSRNRELAHRIAEQGLIISEFPLGTPPSAANFPRRNRIISGLSLGALVVEAARNSGSLITARLSLEQGREVFAIPGSIHNPQTRGCHQLIREGAKLVDQASDIIDDIGSLLGFIAEHPDSQEPPPNQPLDPEYRQLLDVMGYDPVSIDTLVERSGLTVEQLSSMLLILELNEQIRTAPGGYYVRR